MATLDLFKKRRYSEIKLNSGEVFKIPNEYTVEEVERLLELQIIQKKLESSEVNEEKKDKQILSFFNIIFDQLEIIFQNYQPNITSDYLKKHLTQNEALEIIGFFNKYRLAIILEHNKSSKEDQKKKPKELTEQLRDIRRMMTFFVIKGFSLLEIRKLYLDELYDFSEHLIYNLEKTGEMKEGTYAKITKDKSASNKETVNQLRKQLFKSIIKTTK